MINAILEKTPLSSAAKAVREILSENTFLEGLLKDTKRPTEAFIKDVPINFKNIKKDFNVSVYAPVTAYNIEERSGYKLDEAPIFIDVHRKINYLDGSPVFDEIDKFAETVLAILYDQDYEKSLKNTVTFWQFFSKNIIPESSIDTEGKNKIPEEKTLNYIVRITLIIQYTQYYNYLA